MEVSNVQKLLAAVIRGAQAEKVAQMPMAPPPALGQPAAPLEPPLEGAVTPQHVLMASSIARLIGVGDSLGAL